MGGEKGVDVVAISKPSAMAFRRAASIRARGNGLMVAISKPSRWHFVLAPVARALGRPSRDL